MKALDRSMAQAVAWNAAAKWITQILSWLSTIVVARLLTPSDYGVVGMAGLYLGLAMVVSQAGLSEAVIALRDLTRHKIAQLNTVAVLSGIALVGITCSLATPVARFFSAPQLRFVVIVVSVQYLINAFQVIPRALLQKELRFQLLASLEVARVFGQIIATVSLALLNFGYWSLVLGHILGTAASAGLTMYYRRHEFAFPNFTQLRRELRFSGHLTLSGAGWYAYSNSDFLVAGRMLGQVPLGDYTLAWTISSAPLEKIGNLVIGVTPAFFSAVQHDKGELRRYLSRLTEALAYMVVPASIGMALLADYLVPALLGPKWMGVIGPLRLLGLLVAFRALATLPGKVLTAVGEARFMMWTTVASALILPAAFLIGSHWGSNGIAAAWVIMYPPLMLPVYYKAFKHIGMTIREYASTVMPAVGASLIMAGTVFLVRGMMPTTAPLLLRLSFLVGIGAACYCAVLYGIHRDRLSRLFRTIRSLRGDAPHKQPNCQPTAMHDDLESQPGAICPSLVRTSQELD